MTTPPEIDSAYLNVPAGGQVTVSRYDGLERPVTMMLRGPFTTPYKDVAEVKLALTDREASVAATMLLERVDIGMALATALPGALHTLVIPVHKWLSANARGHWSFHSEDIHAFRRDAFYVTKAAKLAPLRHVAIDVTPHGRSALRHDPANCYPTVKAAIDGIADARVLPNDTRTYVERITMNKPQPAESHVDYAEYLVLILEELDD